jgi:hypothetical protein
MLTSSEEVGACAPAGGFWAGYDTAEAMESLERAAPVVKPLSALREDAVALH